MSCLKVIQTIRLGNTVFWLVENFRWSSFKGKKAIAALLLVDFSPDPHANGSSASKTKATIEIAIKNRTSGSSGSRIGPDQVDLMYVGGYIATTILLAFKVSSNVSPKSLICYQEERVKFQSDQIF